METLVYIAPRQSGKTTDAVMEFLKNPKNTIFITYNNISKDEIIKKHKLGKYKNRFFSQTDRNIFIGREYETVIFDEFTLIDKFNILYNDVTSSSRYLLIFCYGTMVKQYKETLYKFILFGKSINLTPQMMIKTLRVLKIEFDENDIYDLYDSILTRQNVRIIDNKFKSNQPYLKNINKERYELDILNKWLI